MDVEEGNDEILEKTLAVGTTGLRQSLILSEKIYGWIALQQDGFIPYFLEFCWIADEKLKNLIAFQENTRIIQ